jgi:hypothetical protein
MSETEVYRERANKYMRFAATMSSPEAKAVMLSMERAWHELAQLHRTAKQAVNSHNGSLMEAS